VQAGKSLQLERRLRAALRGGWVNVLVTDLDTARALLDDTEASPRLQQPAQLPELKAASKEACGGSKSNCRRNVIASAAPRSRSMPASSHSIEIGPA
jgi:hypothetical protein